MRARRFLIAALPLAACAPQVERAPANQVPAARVVGAAVSCLNTSQISDSVVRDDRTIDFRVTGGRHYRNTLPARCPELGFERRFAYTLHTPRLCSTDIITVLHTEGRGASCGLGEFVPVEIDRRR